MPRNASRERTRRSGRIDPLLDRLRPKAVKMSKTEEDTLELDLTPVVIPVRMTDKNGVVRLYEIRDITGTQRDRFLTAQAR